MQGDLKLIYTRAQIQQAVIQIAHEVNNDYSTAQEVVVLCVLKGAFVFTADLIRHLKLNVKVDFVQFSSYNGTKRGGLEFLKAPTARIREANILIVEDIVDSGYTATFLTQYLHEQSATTVRLCTLLVKPSCLKTPVPIHYRGFNIPDVFVVGYGLDYKGLYRNLPGVYELVK